MSEIPGFPGFPGRGMKFQENSRSSRFSRSPNNPGTLHSRCAKVSTSGVARIGVKVGHCRNGLGYVFFQASEASKRERSEPEAAGGVGRSPRKFLTFPSILVSPFGFWPLKQAEIEQLLDRSGC